MMVRSSSSEDEDDGDRVRPLYPPILEARSHVDRRRNARFTRQQHVDIPHHPIAGNRIFDSNRSRGWPLVRKNSFYPVLKNNKLAFPPDDIRLKVAIPVSNRPKSVLPVLVPEKNMQYETSEDSFEETYRKKRQLYIYVTRCVSYSFNANQPTDLVRRNLKIIPTHLQEMQKQFSRFMDGKIEILADEAFKKTVKCYYEAFLCSESVHRLVESKGASVTDFRDVFHNLVNKRVADLEETDGITREDVTSSWMTKYNEILKLAVDEEEFIVKRKRTNAAAKIIQTNENMEPLQTDEELYDMFQDMLGVRKFEHQMLFTVMQLDSADEQAAVARRELDGRLQKILELEKTRKNMPRFVTKEMENAYIKELKMQLDEAMMNLESMPVVSKCNDIKYSLPTLRRRTARSHSLLRREGGGSGEREIRITKADVSLNFPIEVVVIEAKGLNFIPPSRIVYVTMELEGFEKLQTGQAEVTKQRGTVRWDTQGDFTSTTPIPTLKIKLLTESTGMLSVDDTELGKLTLKPLPGMSQNPEWYKMITPKNLQGREIRMKVIIRMSRPVAMKYSGFLFATGKSFWKTWKQRYFAIVQSSQYSFALCSYKEKKNEPYHILDLEGYTVDYIQPSDARLITGVEVITGRYLFNLVKGTESFVFSANNEPECVLWVTWLYRATSQPRKPTPSFSDTLNLDADKVQRCGMEEFINADPCKADHQSFFRMLLRLILEHRLRDPYCSMGWLSPGQVYVLDEYCARYGIRPYFRHLWYLNDLVEKAELGYTIDPHLMHYSYAFCLSSENGVRPDGSSSVIEQEGIKFTEIKNRLIRVLERNITYFRHVFPFGRPKGSLKASVSLLERLYMKEDSTQGTVDEEFRNTLKRCLEKAALINYCDVSQGSKLDDPVQLRFTSASCKEELVLRGVPSHTQPAVCMQELIHLAQSCVEVLRQNDEYYAEAFAWFSNLYVEHTSIFLSVFRIDMDRVLEIQPVDRFDSLPLFYTLNDYLNTDGEENLTAKNGAFHQYLCCVFAGLTIRYLEVMDTTIHKEMIKCLESEIWQLQKQGETHLGVEQALYKKLDTLQEFLKNSNWPEKEFKAHLGDRVRTITCNMMQEFCQRAEAVFFGKLNQNIPQDPLEYMAPIELCMILNVFFHCRNFSMELCSRDGMEFCRYHVKLDEMIESTLANITVCLGQQLLAVLEHVLFIISAYDEGNVIGTVLKVAAQGDNRSGRKLGLSYCHFMKHNHNRLHSGISDELWAIHFFEYWYAGQATMLYNFLNVRGERILHFYQCSCLVHIMKLLYDEFKLQIAEKILRCEAYEVVEKRITTDKVTWCLVMADNDNFPANAFDSRDDDDLGSSTDSNVNNNANNAQQGTSTTTKEILIHKVTTAKKEVVTKFGDLVEKGYGKVALRVRKKKWFQRNQ